MKIQQQLANTILEAIWNEDVDGIHQAVKMGANPSWIVNGYPLLIHAVCTANPRVLTALLDEGAIQSAEALGFALEKGIGQVIKPLLYRGIVPKPFQPRQGFGDYPHRFAF